MSYWTTAFVIIAPLILDIPSIFLIYVIIWRSPSKMKFIRLFLLKMVICGMTTIHLMLWIMMPDLHQPQFPLFLFKINNSYFSDTILLASAFVTGCIASLVFSSLGEECLMRFILTYNIQLVLQFGHEVVFIFLVIVEVAVAVVMAAVVTSQMADGNADALAQFIQHRNATYMLNDFDLDKDTLIFFSPDSPYFKPIATFLTFIGLSFYICIMGLTYLTHWKITKSAGLMSSENFALQKRLTNMLFLQIILPIVFMAIPLGMEVIMTAVIFFPSDADVRYREIYGRYNWVYPLVGGLVFIYPCINSIFTIIVITPYRIAILELFGIGCASCCRVRALPPIMSRDNRRLSQQVHAVTMAETIRNSH